MSMRRKKKLFKKYRGSPLGSTLVVAGLVTLAACAPRTDYWSPPDSPKKNKVSWAEFHHPVHFGAASASLRE